jgi:LysM repeat protein
MIFTKQLFFIFFFSITFVFSQETIKHKVVSGESVFAIAKKYKVTEADIYQLNPKVKGAVLQLNSIIVVPNKNKTKNKTVETNNGVEEHIVAKGETLFAISKKYGISIAKLKERNPNLNDKGLQIGTKINLKPIESSQVIVSTANSIGNDTNFHVVQPKETKFGIAKKYGLTIAELEALNPEIVSNLPIGFQLKLKKGITNSNSNVSIAQSENFTNEDELEDDSLDVFVEEVDIKEVVDVAPMSLDNIFKADFLIATASKNLGAPYRSGGTSANNGFDCSGLVCTTFEKADVKLPRSSHEMATVGIKIHKSKAQKGDLIFFKTRGSRISHVGLITEITENDIKFIHSSTSSGVIISSVNEEYYKKRFVQINRVLN